jgi:hypothetical protein
MAYNFKSIADVEVVAEPAESANVLIEENGVIKKAPKTAVGGAGGAGGADGYDAIVECIDGSSGYFWSMELVSGSFEDLLEKINSGVFPKVLIRYSDSSSSTSRLGVMNACSIVYLIEDNCIRVDFLCYFDMRHFCIYSNGNIENN